MPDVYNCSITPQEMHNRRQHGAKIFQRIIEQSINEKELLMNASNWSIIIDSSCQNANAKRMEVLHQLLRFTRNKEDRDRIIEYKTLHLMCTQCPGFREFVNGLGFVDGIYENGLVLIDPNKAIINTAIKAINNTIRLDENYRYLCFLWQIAMRLMLEHPSYKNNKSSLKKLITMNFLLNYTQYYDILTKFIITTKKTYSRDTLILEIMNNIGINIAQMGNDAESKKIFNCMAQIYDTFKKIETFKCDIRLTNYYKIRGSFTNNKLQSSVQYDELTENWNEAMEYMKQYSIFTQQTDIFNRLISFDFAMNITHYNFVSHKMSQITTKKIYCQDMLGTAILANFGFTVPQFDGKHIVLQYMVMIYRNIEAIEKQKQKKDDTYDSFIQFADDDKYDDDFKNNEDNVIGDFKRNYITPGGPNDDTEQTEVIHDFDCIGSTFKCKHIQRMIKSLKYFSSINMEFEYEIQENDFVQYFKEEHPSLLDDYIHIITKHNANMTQWLGYYKISCSVENCVPLQRYHRDRTQMKGRIDDECDFNFYRDIIESMHCYVYHSSIIRYESPNVHNKKFHIDNIAESGPLLPEMREYMIDIGVEQYIIDTIWSKLESQEYDSDALMNDVAIVAERNDPKQSCLAVLLDKHYHKVFTFVNSSRVSDTSYSIGYRFYYWNYYKLPLDENKEYFQNKNDHSGYRAHELYIEAKYASIKEEILENKLECLEMEQYDIALEKAQKFMQCEAIVSLKAQENKLLHYDIWEGTPLLLCHLLAIILYCDWTDLSAAFSATFRKRKSYESIELTKRRNREFANWSKRLREAVELYGKRGWEKRDKDEKKWNEENNRIRGPFYCGMKRLMVIPEFNIRLCAPTSTSAQIEIAQNFAGDNGIVITLNNNGHWISDSLRMWDCSWLSNYSVEDERLLIGGLYTIRIIGIRKRSTKQNFAAYFKPLFYYDCMMTGVSVRNHEPHIINQHKSILQHLMDCKLNIIRCNKDNDSDRYIHDTFEAYTNHRKQIVINLYQIHKYFGLLKDLFLQTSMKPWDCMICDSKGNNINKANCHFCQALAPMNVHGLNNILKPNMFKLFGNVQHIILYTTSGSGDHEYVLNVHNLLTVLNTVSSDLMRKRMVIEIKASHAYEYNCDTKKTEHVNVSWLSKEWDRSAKKMQSLGILMGWNISFTHTQNHGARVYLEDTLTINI